MYWMTIVTALTASFLHSNKVLIKKAICINSCRGWGCSRFRKKHQFFNVLIDVLGYVQVILIQEQLSKNRIIVESDSKGR
jgi:hypothetical protein